MIEDERFPTPPRAWLSRLAIPAGYRELLIHLWGYGPRWSPGPDDRIPDSGEVRVWPTRRRVALETGRSLSTIDGRFEWLIEHGWIRPAEEGGWRLAVGKARADWVDEHNARSKKTPPTGPVVFEPDPAHGANGPRPRGQRTPPTGPTDPAHGAQKTSGTEHDETAKKPTPTKRTRRRSQTEFDLGADPPEPDETAQLLRDHEALRAEAQDAHEVPRGGWPGPHTGKGKSLRARLRAAVRTHGADACRRVLEHSYARWLEDAGALERYSLDTVWSPKWVKPVLDELNGRKGQPRGSPQPSPSPSRRSAPSFQPETTP